MLAWNSALFYYTNEAGYKAIGAQPVWLFKVSQPPGDRSKAAYFSTLPPGTPNLSKRLFVRGCAEKTAFVFCFSGGEGLLPLRGGRGAFIYYSEVDYAVLPARQGLHGATRQVQEKLK